MVQTSYQPRKWQTFYNKTLFIRQNGNNKLNIMTLLHVINLSLHHEILILSHTSGTPSY